MYTRCILDVNPYPAVTVYTRVEVSNKMPLKLLKIAFDRCSVNQIIELRRCLFFILRYIFRHLQPEIALAIPASNDEKYETIQQSKG